MGQQGKGTGEDDCTNRSAAIDAAIAGYCSAIRTIYNKDNCCWEQCNSDIVSSTFGDKLGTEVLEQCSTWREGQASWSTFTLPAGGISNIKIIRGRQRKRWQERRRRKRYSVWTRAKFATTKCRELERRRWTWRHATAAKQARFTIITNRAYVPRPDRNTTEWPPDLKSSGTSQPASKAWFGPHAWRAHDYGPSNGNATSVSDDASLYVWQIPSWLPTKLPRNAKTSLSV